jgi:hypothetical protein
MESPACPRGRAWIDRQAITFFLCMLLAGAVTPAQCKVVTYGIGLKSCETYLAAKEQDSRQPEPPVRWS